MNVRKGSEPDSPLTRVCAAVAHTLDNHPDYGGERCIVLMSGRTFGGLQLHGYEDETEALIDLLHHARAIMQSKGGDLGVMPFPGRG